MHTMLEGAGVIMRRRCRDSGLTTSPTRCCAAGFDADDDDDDDDDEEEDEDDEEDDEEDDAAGSVACGEAEEGDDLKRLNGFNTDGKMEGDDVGDDDEDVAGDLPDAVAVDDDGGVPDVAADVGD